MRIPLFAIACVLAAGCSKARPVGDVDASGDDDPDARETVDAADTPDAPDHIDAEATTDAPPAPPDAPPDAPPPPPDAMLPPVTITLSQNTDTTTITSLNSVSCNDTVQNAENSYYRAFALADHGVVGAFTINSVSFAVEEASSGPQPATIKLYTYAGVSGGATLDTTQFTLLAALNISIQDGTATNLSFPMTAIIPANGTVVMELLTPDAQAGATGDLFFIGSNAAGQTQPSYLRAPDCGAALPTSIATLGFPTMHQIMTITGTYQP